MPTTKHPNTRTPTHSVFDLRASLESSFEEVRAILEEMKSDKDPRIRLAAASEMRKHIALAKDTLETLLKAEASAAVEQAILQALAEAGPRVRTKVLKILESRSIAAST